MFAIIEAGHSQYKIQKGDQIDVYSIDGKEGSNIELNKVLLIEDNGKTEIGNPYIKGALVKAKIIAHKRDDKIVVFKMKPKKRYQKTQGHRQDLTTLEISEIKVGAKKATSAKKSEKED